MNIRRKTLLIIALFSTVFLAGLLNFIRFEVVETFGSIEQVNVQKNLNVLEGIIKHQEDLLRSSASAHVRGTIPDTIEPGVDGLYIIDSAGNGRLISDQSNDAFIHETAKHYFGYLSRLLRFTPYREERTGIVKSGPRLYLFSARIVPNAQPERAAIVVFKELGKRLIADLEKQVSVKLDLRKFDETRDAPFYLEQLENLRDSHFSQIEESEDDIRARLMLKDVFGKPVAELGLSFDRTIHLAGQRASFNIMLLVTLGFAALILIIARHLDTAILRRVLFMSDELSLVEAGFLNRVTALNEDELSGLARRMNELLSSNENKNKELIELNNLITKQQESVVSAAKLSALGTMAASIAHEINNPLMIIQSRAKSIERELSNPDLFDYSKIKSSADGIIMTVARISRTVQSLKNFAKDSNCDKFDYFEINQLVREAIAICELKLKLGDVNVSFDNCGEHKIYCRPNEIVELFVNLISNSYDATKNVENKWIHIGTEIRDNTVKVTVSDSGSGIPEDIRGKVMLPFFSTKEIGQGNGLGLSISKKIVETHNGKFSLDDHSKNTTFVVEFPMVG